MYQKWGISSEDYKYLACADFRSIRREYSTAVAQAGYVVLYYDLNGDLCALVKIQYKITSNWSETILHNLTSGKTINDPANYYKKLADRYYGATKIRYMKLSSEVLENEAIALQGMREMLTYGTNSYAGAYVSAKELNL